MNNVTLIGRLTADPESVEYDNDGEHGNLAKFRLAVDRGPDATDFVPVTAFGKTAAAVLDYCSKGRQVAITGTLRSSEWTRDDGTTAYGLEVIANKVDFLAKPKDTAE
jgi:single-strand DNA-binding protein